MGRHPGAAANAVLQGQGAAQGDQAFCATEDGVSGCVNMRINGELPRGNAGPCCRPTASSD